MKDNYDYFLGESPPGPNPIVAFFLICVALGGLAAIVYKLAEMEGW